MSLIKSATRRLSLLAGSSLVAASLSAAASVAVTLVPATAAAQTCTPADPPAVNPGADSYTCSGTPHAAGITYTSAGSPLTLTTTTSGMDIGPAGINLTGVGSDSVTFNSAVEVDGAGIVGALLDIRTASGAININSTGTSGVFLDADDSSSAQMTHGILAESTSGAITMNLAREVDAENGTTAALAVAGIEARTGGAGSISMTTNAVRGRLYGIRAETTGTGGVTISTGSSVSASAATGVGIHVTAGTGLVTVTGAASGGDIGTYIDADGDVAITLAGSGMSGGNYGIYLENVAAGTTTTVTAGVNGFSGGLAGLFAQGAGELIVNAAGSANIDVTGMAQRTVITSTPGRFLTLNGNMVRGDYELTITADSGGYGGGLELTGSANINVVEPPSVAVFSGDDSVFINEGVIAIGASATNGRQMVDGFSVGLEAELRMEGLGEFRNSGRILLGAAGRSTGGNVPGVLLDGIRIDGTDGWYDDILSMPGAHWVGEGGEVWMDIDTNRTQTDCVTRNAEGDLGAADCLRIVGGSTEGTTYLTLFEIFPNDRGRFSEEGILLVDVAGGTSAQGHFVVSPNTPGYDPAFGGSLSKGMFQYVIAYDESAQQHKLVSIIGGSAYQAPLLAASVQSLWRTSTGTWLDRQADLRGGLDDGIGGGVWLRASADRTDRDVFNTSVAAGQNFDFDNTLTEDSYAVMGGLDLATAESGDQAYVVGLMAGYVHSDVEYEANPNTARLNGGSLGGYASFISGGLFVDAAVNAQRLTMRQEIPGLNLFPAGTLVSTRLNTLGAQVEAGWRFPLGMGFVEPLAGLSYVRSKYDDIQIVPSDANRPGLTIAYDDPTSLRGGIGGRVGIENDFGFVRTQVSLLGRVWNEFEGENAAIIHNVAFPTDPDVTLVDDFSGRFNEVALGASVYSAGGAVSGFLNIGGRFGDDYEAKTGSVGVRVAW